MTRAITPTPARPAQASQRGRPAGPTIDPVRIIRQNLLRIILVTMGGAVLGVALNYALLVVYPVWSAQVLLEIKSQLETATDLNAKDIGTEDTVVRLAQTEVARLTQKDNLSAAMLRPEILKTTWSDQYKDANGVFVVEDAVLDLDGELRSGHRRGTQIFYISWGTRVPEDAPIVLNALADTYIDTRKRSDDARFSNTLAQYEKKRAELDKAILDKKKDIQDFIRKNGLTSLTEANSENQRRLEKLSNDIAQTTADLNISQSRRTQIEQKQRNESGWSDDDKRRAQEDPIVLQLQRDTEDYGRRFKSAKQQFGETHPSYIALKAEYDETQRAIDRKMEEVLKRNLAADYKDSFNKEESFSKLLKKQNEDFKEALKRVEDFTANMAEMRGFEDQIAVLQEQRREVGKTIQDISLAMQRDESKRVEIVQRALKPREITFPRFKVMIPATAVLVAGLYILILFVREFLDQRVKYPSDLMSVPGKILGAVPELSDDPTDPKRTEMVVREASQSVLAENFRQLSAQVMKSMLVSGAKSLLVLSAMPEAGTTTVTLNLAACEAAVGRRVLIIGANMRRPGLGRALGINLGMPGLGEILSGADPASVVITVSPNIDLIPAGAPEHRVFERLSGDRLDAVLRWANDHYDFVIVDGPPSVVAGEALTIANKVDASMIVARAWKDQRGLVMKLAGQLLESRSQFLGVMLNRMHMTAGGYLRKNAEAMAEYAEHTTAFGGTDTVAEQTKRKAKPKAT